MTTPVISQLIVLDNIYYRIGNNPPMNFGTPHTQIIKSEEQPYQREMRCDTDWTKLDFMWIKNPGMILIENKESPYIDKQPTPETIEEVNKRIIELAFIKKPPVEPLRRTMHSPPKEPIEVSCDIPVSPGRNVRIYITPEKDLYIRCACGVAKFNLVVFPRCE